jgi:hypothetical protein
VRRAWRALPSDHRLAAAAALGLFLTLFLPWYQETGLAEAGSRVQAATASLTGWAAFSWVEAAILLVAAAVLALLFLRAEGHAFQLPGGDGVIVTAAGGWTCLLVIWRIIDKEGVSHQGPFATTWGIEWGIFIALGVAGTLTYAGSRIRAAHPPGSASASAQPPAAVPPGSAVTPTTPQSPPTGDPPTTTEPEPWPEHEAPRTRGSGAARGRRRPGPAAARRAAWAEPVTWNEPATIAAPPGASEPPARERPRPGGCD